jgi:hypothetical protein
MRHGFTGSILIAGIVVLGAVTAAAQTGAIPRMPDGRPNLQGIWQVLAPAAWDIQDHSPQPGVPAGQGVVEGNDLPYQPWALKRKQENSANRATADPDSKGYLPGVPRIMYMPFPFQIFQTPTHVAMTFEYAQGVRIVYTNGTPHPRGPIEWWLGDSRGTWDRDTFVVDAVHFTDQTWLDRAGNFHSEALHLVERYTMTGPDHINYEVVIDDPKVFTRPWKMSMVLYRRKEPNVRLLDYVPGLLTQEEIAEQQNRKTN